MGCKDCGEKKPGHNHDGCLCEVLRFIKRVQDIGTNDECVECNTDCFMAPLGTLGCSSKKPINTRVFMLLTADGTPFKAMFRPESTFTPPQPPGTHNCFSVFFRVQSVSKDCCATLQVLEPQDNNYKPVDLFDNKGNLDFDKICDVENFGATDSCITVDLKHFVGTQCIDDVFIEFCN